MRGPVINKAVGGSWQICSTLHESLRSNKQYPSLNVFCRITNPPWNCLIPHVKLQEYL